MTEHGHVVVRSSHQVPPYWDCYRQEISKVSPPMCVTLNARADNYKTGWHEEFRVGGAARVSPQLVPEIVVGDSVGYVEGEGSRQLRTVTIFEINGGTRNLGKLLGTIFPKEYLIQKIFDWPKCQNWINERCTRPAYFDPRSSKSKIKSWPLSSIRHCEIIMRDS